MRYPLIASLRPNFLLLALLCAGLGVVLTLDQKVVSPLLCVGVLLGALLAHASVNLLNEYDDFCTGLDATTERTPFSGGSGALPAQPSAAPLVLYAGLGTLLGAVVIGLYFVWRQGWPLLLLGVLGCGLVLAYTRWLTRSPWLCFLAPGVGFAVMVLSSVLALGGQLTATVWWVAGVVMLLCSELLLLNQFPDVDADRLAGRRHLPIVFGIKRMACYVIGLWWLAYSAVILGVISNGLPIASLGVVVTLPLILMLRYKLKATIGMENPDAIHWSAPLGLNVTALLVSLALLLVSLSIK
ncbi:prenyltransferase [Halomonas sp. LS-001]